MDNSKKIQRVITSHPLFSVLPEEALDRIYLSITKQSFLKGQYLFFQGDDGDCAFIILNGKILLETISVDGGRLSFDELRPNAFFGEFAILDDGPRSTSAVAISRVSVISIPKSILKKLILDYPVFSEQIIKRLVRLMRNADAHLESMQFKNLLQKVAHHLANEHMRRQPVGGRLKITQADIARVLSASREKVNKSIQILKNRDILQTTRGQITVKNLDALKKIYILD